MPSNLKIGDRIRMKVPTTGTMFSGQKLTGTVACIEDDLVMFHKDGIDDKDLSRCFAMRWEVTKLRNQQK